jgi:hypothetical protein
MENESSKNDGIIKENIIKVDQILLKILQDFKQGIIDPINLEEIRKFYKVKIVNS